MWPLVILGVVALGLLTCCLLIVNRSWTTATQAMSTERQATDATTRETISALRETTTAMSDLAQTMVFGPQSRQPTSGEPGMPQTTTQRSPESEIDSLPLGPELLAVEQREAEEDGRDLSRREQLRYENAQLREQLTNSVAWLESQGVNPSEVLRVPLPPLPRNGSNPMSSSSQSGEAFDQERTEPWQSP